MEGNEHSEATAPEKSLFRIGEVSRLTATKPFVLRYWETEFPTLQPVKSPKGHRLYRREDIDTVFVIKRLLYDEGFTIAGARRHLRDQDVSGNGLSGTSGPNGASGLTGSSGTGESTDSPSIPHAECSAEAQPRGPAISRQTLLDLRESLRSLLTALESE
jgi:DNA-binding transcriptional MerR regulator